MIRLVANMNQCSLALALGVALLVAQNKSAAAVKRFHKWAKHLLFPSTTSVVIVESL